MVRSAAVADTLRVSCGEVARARAGRTRLGLVAIVVGAVVGVGGCTGGTSRGSAAPSAQRVSVMGSADMRQYGIHVDLLYRAATPQHVLSATLHASGITGRTEMYKTGTDTSGMPQQPTLAVGQTTSVTAFAFPTCGTPGLGAHPSLSVVSMADGGGTTTQTIPLDSLARTLQSLAGAWCAHGVMIGVSSSQGYSGCDQQTATLLVRNPAPASATVTVDGRVYTAPALTVPAASSASWTVRSSGGCPAHPTTATVRYADGTVTRVSLGFDSSL